MFCPKCGKRNDEDAKYCAYCGGEIVDTQPEEVSPGQFLRNRLEVFFRGDARKGGAAAKSFLVRHRKALAVCAVVAAVLVGGVSTLRTLFSPERSAKRFFENYMSGDWAAVYQEIDLPEGEMLDEAHLLQVAVGALGISGLPDGAAWPDGRGQSLSWLSFYILRHRKLGTFPTGCDPGPHRQDRAAV